MSPALDLKPAVSNSHTNGIPSNRRPHSDGFSTLSVHVGSSPDPSTGAVIPPISLSTTYAQSAPGLHKGFEYSRSDNPNRNALEQLLASIEKGGEEAMAFGSGSAATGVVVQALGSGAHVLSVNDVYGGTYRYLNRVATEIQSLEVTLLDLERVDEEVIRENIRENTKLIWLESPTNPTLKLMDVTRLARIARSHPSQPLLLVDNTFLSPYYSSPLLLGADIVLHSLTKYVNGHADVVMGALILPPSSSEQHRAFKDKLRFLQNATGAVPSAYDSWLAHRGAKTLGLRMRQHGVSALKVAKLLKTHPLVEEVMYPGLEGNKNYDLAWASLSAHARRWIEKDVLLRDIHHASAPSSPPEGGFPFSGMISFRLPTHAHALAFLTSTRLFTLAESLGGVESLAEHPASMTHAGIPKEEREELGITDGLVRLSVGIEDVEDLIEDVRQALEKSARVDAA
ncbi:hypothetical protein EST38_g5664 [Candolleomyces aberdarensis]|uniref:cystathionine gamma-lyase n=1 Tax=Candolleomyces aberdarensis TaxID=2316362 RepID=A0A4Q2DK07_9AGAR|nr:hypothetical protein EST38_g5664 [Candolleomyces aberdarensis]